MFKIYTCDKATIAEVDPAEPSPHVIISVTTPGDPLAVIAPDARPEKILRLVFHDLPWSDEEAARRDWSSCFYGQVTLFTAAMAKQIWYLVMATRGLHGEALWPIVVHCDAGVSRSGAIAVAIQKRFGGQLICQNPPVPNIRVLEIMRETAPRR